jgi:hypothetical protein
MQLLVVCVAMASGCASSGALAPGWQPSVWSTAPVDPNARDAVVPFPDGQNGTELVITMLSRAREAGATGLSNFEIQVGRCTRAIALALPAEPVAHSPDLDRITFDAHETAYTCRNISDLALTPGTPDSRGIVHFSDAQMVVREDCTHTPRQHIVTRYRIDVDRRFVPPDWSTIAQLTNLDLHASEPRCDDGEPRNELRIRMHFGTATAPALPARAPDQPAADPNAIVELARRAEAEAKQDHAVESTRLANLALSAWGDGATVDRLDEATAKQVVYWVAAAHYYAVEAAASAYLASVVPEAANDEWAARQSTELQHITNAYQAVRDAIRMPEVGPWLRAGAAQLARLHEHLAVMLDSVNQHHAAEQQREQVRTLETAARAP